VRSCRGPGGEETSAFSPWEPWPPRQREQSIAARSVRLMALWMPSWLLPVGLVGQLMTKSGRIRARDLDGSAAFDKQSC